MGHQPIGLPDMSIKVVYATKRIDDYYLHCDINLFTYSQVVTKLSKMTFNASSESKRSVYDTCDPHYLRELREAAGIDLVVLARTACLSVAQVRQLETDDSDSLFYSDAIKRQAYKRLLMILGAEPPVVEVPHELRDAGKVAEAHLNTLDQIVAMSHQPAINRSTSDVLAAILEKLKEHQQVMGALLLLVGAVALFVWNDLQSGAEPAPAASVASAPAASASLSVAAVETSSVPVMVASAPALVSSLPSVALVASAPAPMVVSPVASAPTIAVAAPASAAASAVAQSSVTTPKVGACAYSSDAMPQLTSLFAQKEGRYVYFVSTANIEICVVDGNKQATLLQLKAGENRSVYGASPWQLSGAGLQKAQIYFQGGRVSLPDANTTRLKLVEVPVAR
jgi:cytoskeletal protein RodZ